MVNTKLSYQLVFTVSAYLYLFVIVTAISITSSSAAAADLPVTLSVERSNSVDLRAFNTPPKSIVSVDNLSAAVEGTESSQCTAYGRQSAASGAAQSAVTNSNESSVQLKLYANSYAQGGHFRTCIKCFSQLCVGIHGNDTRGDAIAKATATVTVQFSNNYEHPGDYYLNVSHSDSGATPIIQLFDSANNLSPLASSDGNPAVVRGGPGKIYYLRIREESSTSNLGGCCNDNKESSSVVDVSLKKVPFLLAGYLTGYIAGGTQTVGYPEVGAITVDDQLLCTGTLVGHKTVLTAAHCLADYVDQIKKMRFVMGANYQYPTQPPLEIADVNYPKGEISGFKYNPKDYEDDIGVMYLKMPVLTVPASLYGGVPTWDDIESEHQSLIFVGFGYNVLGGELGGQGIKREGSWQIDVVTNRTVAFKVPGHNTCHGDSGGPAFVESNSMLFLAAVSSTGDKNCTMGVETRIDAYTSWLAGKIL